MESRAKYIPELDGLRGIAVLMVIFHHISQNVYGFTSEGFSGRAVKLWLRITTPGWMGVDIFFVLSGFLITGVLMDAKGRPHFYRNFYMKRILRIFPLYYLTLLLMLPFYAWPWSFFGLCTIYLANVSTLFRVPMVLAPLWSLSVEEHFYFVWPWVVRFLNIRAIFIAAIALCLLEPAFRYFAFQHGFFDPYFSWFRLDGLACGALLAIAVRHQSALSMKLWGSILCGTAIGVFFASLPYGGGSRLDAVGTAFLYSCISLFTGGIVSFLVAHSPYSAFSILRTRSLRFIGDISFCLYLVHMFVLDGFHRSIHAVFHREWFGGVVHNQIVAYFIFASFVFLICLTLGTLSRDYFEGPIRHHRVRFE